MIAIIFQSIPPPTVNEPVRKSLVISPLLEVAEDEGAAAACIAEFIGLVAEPPPKIPEPISVNVIGSMEFTSS
jgi:hypothetical protein